MSGTLSDAGSSRYWAWVAGYVVVLLLAQSVMGLGVDKFKELWGEGALDVVAYAIASTGALAVVWVGGRVWARSRQHERVWMVLALAAYGIGTLTARSPQERLHYLGYGVLAVLLYIGFAPGASGYGAVWRAGLKALALGSGIGLADELFQIAWPRRYFDWADVGINAISVALGLVVAIPAWNALRRTT